MIFIILLLSVFLGDLLLKKYIEAKFPDDGEKPIFGGRILIRKLHNRGIALGGIADSPALVRRGHTGFDRRYSRLFYCIIIPKGELLCGRQEPRCCWEGRCATGLTGSIRAL